MGLKTIVWNYCGAKKPGFLRALKYLMKIHHIRLIALLETQVSGITADQICQKIGLHSFRVEAVRRRGGIRLLWDDDITVDILQTDDCFIHSEIKYQNQEASLLTVVYALPPVTVQEEYWRKIADLAPPNQFPWRFPGTSTL